MYSFNFWNKWLLTASYIVILFGLLLIVLNQNTAIFHLLNEPIQQAFYGDSAISPATTAFQQWAYSIMGALLVGWGILLTFISTHAFRNRERWAWNSFALSLIFWFIPDTFLSMYYQVYYNVFMNTLIFVALALPLAMTRKYFIYFK